MTFEMPDDDYPHSNVKAENVLCVEADKILLKNSLGIISAHILREIIIISMTVVCMI